MILLFNKFCPICRGRLTDQGDRLVCFKHAYKKNSKERCKNSFYIFYKANYSETYKVNDICIINCEQLCEIMFKDDRGIITIKNYIFGLAGNLKKELEKLVVLL